MVKEVTQVLRRARREGFRVEDRGTHFRIYNRQGQMETIHKTLDGKVSTHKGVANVEKFMRVSGPQKDERPIRHGKVIQGGECVECGMLPDEPHKPECSYREENKVQPQIPSLEAAPPAVEVLQTCGVCNETFTGASDGNGRRMAALEKARHMRLVHPKPDQKLPCEFCDFVGKSPQSIGLHRRRAHGDLVGAVSGAGRPPKAPAENPPVKTSYQAPATPEGAARLAQRHLTALIEAVKGLEQLAEVMSNLIEENTKLRKNDQKVQDLLNRAFSVRQ